MAEPSRATRRIFGNLGRLLGGKAGAGVVSLIYMVLAARALGRADYGVLVLVHTYVTAVAGVIEFPGWHAIVRYGAAAQAGQDAPRLSRLLGFAGAVELACGALAVVVAAVFAPFAASRLGWSPEATALALPYSLAALGTIRATPAGYLQLKGRFDLLGLHNMAAPLVRLAGAAVAVLCHAGLRGFLIAWLAAALVEWASMWMLGAWVARGGGLSLKHLAHSPSATLRENPGLLRFMLGANADVTLSEFSGRLTPLAIGWLLGPGAAGLYALAQRVTSVIAQPALILGQAAYAEFAHLVAGADRGASLRPVLLRTVGAALLAAAPVCLVIMVFGERLAVLIGGRSFAAAAVIMTWLALARSVQLAGPPMSAALTALGRPGLSVRANLASGIAALAALPLLVQWQGLTGVGLQAVFQAMLAAALLAVGLSQAMTASPARDRHVRA